MSCDQGEDTDQRQSRQHWDGGLGRPRRQYELEQRDRIAQSSLKRPERTVSAPQENSKALHCECDYGDGELAVTTTCHYARPDVGKAGNFDHGNRHMTDPE
jgi:hypothetical protein